MSASSGSRFTSSSVTGVGSGSTAFRSHHAEPPGRVRVVGVVVPDDLDDPDDRLALVRMVEEAAVADLHGHEVQLGEWLRTPVQGVPASPAATCSSQDQAEGSDL